MQFNNILRIKKSSILSHTTNMVLFLIKIIVNFLSNLQLYTTVQLI